MLLVEPAEFCGGALRERSSVDGLPVGDFRFGAATHSVGNYIDVWAGSYVEAKPGALGMEGQLMGLECAVRPDVSVV